MQIRNSNRRQGRGGWQAVLGWRNLLWFWPLFFLGGCSGTQDGDTRLCWNGEYGLLAVSEFSPLGRPDSVRLTLLRLDDLAPSSSVSPAVPQINSGQSPAKAGEKPSAPQTAEGGEKNRMPESAPVSGLRALLKPAAPAGQAVIAETVGKYRGMPAGILPSAQGFLVVFTDGTMMRLQGHALRPVSDGDNALHFLNVVGNGKNIFALQALPEGAVQVYRYAGVAKTKAAPASPQDPQTPPDPAAPLDPAEESDEENGPAVRPGMPVAYAVAQSGATGDGPAVPAASPVIGGWQPYGPALPRLTRVAMAEMTLLGGDPVVFWRAMLGQEAEAGIRCSRLSKDGTNTLRWQLLPPPPGLLLNGVFAVSTYQDGILLMQEPGNSEKQPKQNTVYYYSEEGGWTVYAPVLQVRYEPGRTAASLTLASGGKRAYVLRISGYGLEAFTSTQPDTPAWQRLLLPGATIPQNNPGWVMYLIPAAVFLGTLLILRALRGRMQQALARQREQNGQSAGEPVLLINTAVCASPLDRAVALLLDGALVSPVAVFYVGSAEKFSQNLLQSEGLVAYLLLLGALIVYSFAAEALFGQTFGKWVMRLRVRAIDGGRPTLTQIAVRNVLRLADFFPVVLGGAMFCYLIALMSVVSTRRRQRLGDYIAGTLVRRVPALSERKLVLASASPRRQMLLEKMGLKFSVAPADIDETPVKGVPAREMAERLARRKADTVAQDAAADAVVLAADTIVVCDDVVLGKPADREDAKRMLRQLSGRSHQVITAVSLTDKATGQFMDGSDLTEVVMRELSEDEIARYVETGEADDKAGAYAIQGQAGAFVVHARGSVSNVVGLPVEMLREMLEDLS